MPFARLSIRTLSVAALAVALTAGAARAPRHTTLVKSEPATGSTVAKAPTQLKLYYSERVDLKVSKFKLTGGRGGAITLGPASIDETQRGMPVVVPVTGSVSSGAYTIDWTVASDDGHAVKGTIHFTVK